MTQTVTSFWVSLAAKVTLPLGMPSAMPSWFCPAMKSLASAAWAPTRTKRQSMVRSWPSSSERVTRKVIAVCWPWPPSTTSRVTPRRLTPVSSLTSWVLALPPETRRLLWSLCRLTVRVSSSSTSRSPRTVRTMSRLVSPAANSRVPPSMPSTMSSASTPLTDQRTEPAVWASVRVTVKLTVVVVPLSPSVTWAWLARMDTRPSSLTTVVLALAVPMMRLALGLPRVTVSTSLGSTTRSPSSGMVMVLLTSPTPKTRLPEGSGPPMSAASRPLALQSTVAAARPLSRVTTKVSNCWSPSSPSSTCTRVATTLTVASLSRIWVLALAWPPSWLPALGPLRVTVALRSPWAK